eukprot:scaffold17129_cov95-Skeletonema_dohrnii-CCMP3373.AAC.1
MTNEINENHKIAQKLLQREERRTASYLSPVTQIGPTAISTNSLCTSHTAPVYELAAGYRFKLPLE